MFGFLKRLRRQGKRVRVPIVVRIDATEKGRIRTLDDMARLPARAIIVALGVDEDGDVCDVFHAHKLTDNGDVWDVCGGPKDAMTSQEILDQDLFLATLAASVMPTRQTPFE
nr:MAG TPA: hypothetical protein [Caudoviricetes sp.]